jgi:DNA-binding transcriptional LysR family regulator
MDISRVRYFHVFTEVGSLVKASAILNISQPALSKSLRVLESEIGLKLLESDGRGLRLTSDGHKFRKQTAPLLTQWLELPARLKGEIKSATSRYGSFEVFTTYFLGVMMKHVKLESLEVHEYGPGQLEAAVADERVDIGVTYLPIPKAGVEFLEVTKIRMGVFGASQHAGHLFEKIPFVIPLHPAEGTPSKVMGLDGWPDHKFHRTVNFRVTMMESALELARHGHAVVYLPEFVARLHNENVIASCKLHEIPSPISKKESLQSVFLVRRPQGDETKLEKQIARCLRSLA